MAKYSGVMKEETLKGINLDCGYRIDLLVEKCIVLEIKCVKKIEDIHLAQILTYMKLGKYSVGLIINFNVISLKDGIKRVVNKSKE